MYIWHILSSFCVNCLYLFLCQYPVFCCFKSMFCAYVHCSVSIFLSISGDCFRCQNVLHYSWCLGLYCPSISGIKFCTELSIVGVYYLCFYPVFCFSYLFTQCVYHLQSFTVYTLCILFSPRSAPVIRKRSVSRRMSICLSGAGPCRSLSVVDRKFVTRASKSSE